MVIVPIFSFTGWLIKNDGTSTTSEHLSFLNSRRNQVHISTAELTGAPLGLNHQFLPWEMSIITIFASWVPLLFNTVCALYEVALCGHTFGKMYTAVSYFKLCILTLHTFVQVLVQVKGQGRKKNELFCFD